MVGLVEPAMKQNVDSRICFSVGMQCLESRLLCF